MPSAQDKTITFWNIAGIYDVEDPNDKTKKPEDFYISQAIGRFQAANPGLTVQMEITPRRHQLIHEVPHRQRRQERTGHHGDLVRLLHARR